jgi:hypothetical protein
MPARSTHVAQPSLADSGRYVYSAAVFALTEPGPAAIGLVVTDRRGRALAHRAQYLGQASRAEASAQALLVAARFAASHALVQPIFRVDDPALAAALQQPANGPGGIPLAELREVLAALPGSRVESVGTAANPARSVAAAPLLDWLPERTRRAEDLQVRRLDQQTFEVQSESRPGEVYRVRLGPGSEAGDSGVSCECADFQNRGIPCKHLLAAAREAGGLEHLFYPDRQPTPRG